MKIIKFLSLFGHFSRRLFNQLILDKLLFPISQKKSFIDDILTERKYQRFFFLIIISKSSDSRIFRLNKICKRSKAYSDSKQIDRPLTEAGLFAFA